MQQHPLGDQPLCGAQLRYLFSCPAGYLGAAAFQSASFALLARDQWIGWSEPTRRGNLARVVANARFLVLPSVSVPHLASHLLGRLTRQLPEDWEARYGVRPLLLETFVHPDYDGTCYKAAGWECVGQSAGRRDGVAKAICVGLNCGRRSTSWRGTRSPFTTPSGSRAQAEALGGFIEAGTKAKIRIDNVQHAISAMVRSLDLPRFASFLGDLLVRGEPSPREILRAYAVDNDILT